MEHESTAVGQSARPSIADIPGIVLWTAFVGLGAALAGVIDGIVLMAKSGPGMCGSYFLGEKTGEAPCRVHPRLGEGLAIAAISLGLGAVVLLLAYLSSDMLRRDTPRL